MRAAKFFLSDRFAVIKGLGAALVFGVLGGVVIAFDLWSHLHGSAPTWRYIGFFGLLYVFAVAVTILVARLGRHEPICLDLDRACPSEAPGGAAATTEEKPEHGVLAPPRAPEHVRR